MRRDRGVNTLPRVDLAAAARILDRTTTAPAEAEVAWTAPVDRFSFRAFAGPTGNVIDSGNVRSFAVHDGDGNLLNKVTVPEGVGNVAPEFRPDGGFYVGTEQGVRCYSASGEQLWDGPGRGIAVAAGPEGNAYVDSRSQLKAYRPDGTLAWEKRHDGASHDPAVRPDGVVVVLEGDGTILAFDADGSERWRNTTRKAFALYGGDLGLYLAPPAPGPGGTTHLLTRDGEVRQLGPEGEELWGSRVGGRGDKYRPLVVDGLGNVFVTGGEQNRDLLGLDSHGNLFFQRKDALVDGMTPLPGGGVAFKGREGILGVGPDGQPLWHFQGDEPLSYLGAPTVAPDGTVHVCGQERLYALDVTREDPMVAAFSAPEAPAPEVTEADSWILIGGVRLDRMAQG